MSAARTAATTTKIAPAPRLVKIEYGTISIPVRASTTMPPLKNTARLAVLAAIAMAAPMSRPARRSSRKRETMSSE